MATLADYYLEMPAVNEAVQGRRHRFVYGYKSKFFDGPQIGIAKVRCKALCTGCQWSALSPIALLRRMRSF